MLRVIKRKVPFFSLYSFEMKDRAEQSEKSYLLQK